MVHSTHAGAEGEVGEVAGGRVEEEEDATVEERMEMLSSSEESLSRRLDSMENMVVVCGCGLCGLCGLWSEVWGLRGQETVG